MKKIDKLILKSFVGPFFFTFLVIVFILLSRHMLMYFDDIIGKGLGAPVIAQLLIYFAIFMIPMAIPLAVLMSSLIAFGNLSEHGELNAIKSAGISLPRILVPIFVVVVFLTGAAFFANNYLVPKAALEAYSLMFDIRQKKPAMSLSEGIFYDEIPGISIKVNKKFSSDDRALKDIILYQYDAGGVTSEVIVADSGRMESILNESYLRFELFKGFRYTEGLTENSLPPNGQSDRDVMTRSSFSKIEMVYNLSSFELTRTNKGLFDHDKLTRDISQLSSDIHSMEAAIIREQKLQQAIGIGLFKSRDTIHSARQSTAVLPEKIHSAINSRADKHIAAAATANAREIKNQWVTTNAFIREQQIEKATFEVQKHRILANSVACIVMFLIGAPLGAIIRRGGLAVPFLISIVHFIVYYILGMQGAKLTQQLVLTPVTGVWAANILLFLIGIMLLRQAQRDVRLFESEFYLSFTHLFQNSKRLFNR